MSFICLCLAFDKLYFLQRSGFTAPPEDKVDVIFVAANVVISQCCGHYVFIQSDNSDSLLMAKDIWASLVDRPIYCLYKVSPQYSSYKGKEIYLQSEPINFRKCLHIQCVAFFLLPILV